MVLDDTVHQAVAASAVGHNVGLAIHTRCWHTGWPKNALGEEVTIEHSGHPPDEDAQGNEAEVAVAAPCAGGKAERLVANQGKEFVFRTVLAEVKVLWIARQAGRVLEQVSHRERLPGWRRVRNIPGERRVERYASVIHEH